MKHVDIILHYIKIMHVFCKQIPGLMNIYDPYKFTFHMCTCTVVQETLFFLELQVALHYYSSSKFMHSKETNDEQH